MNKPKRAKVCYILPLYDPTTEQHFGHLYPFLVECSHHLDLLVVVEKSPRGQGVPGIKKCYVQRFKFPPLRALELFWILLRARLRGYSNFYTHYSYYGALLAGLLSRATGGRSFYWNCEMIGDFFRKWDWSPSTLAFYLSTQWPVQGAIKLSHVLVTGTQSMAEYYSRLAGKERSRIRTMPNWVDLKAYHDLPDRRETRKKLKIMPDDKVILFVHKLSERKGVHYLVPILKKVREAVPNAVLMVVGDGPRREALAGWAKRGGVEEAIRLVGAVPHNQVSLYMAAADVFLMPSDQEGFPRALLEAMAAGLPCVASDAGGTKEVLGERPPIPVLPRGDETAMAMAVIALLSDENLRERGGSYGKNRARIYDQSAAVSRFIHILSEKANPSEGLEVFGKTES